MTSYRYIVIDDEILIRKGLISKIDEIVPLKTECVGEAANGLEGLERIEELKPDIVITDMKMKKMDGVEFLEKVSERYPNIPIIVVSGYKAFDYVKKAIEKRAIGYVLKPFSTDEIEKQLRKAIEQLEKQENILRLTEKVKTFEQRKEQDILLSTVLELWDEGIEKELREKNYEIEDYYLLISLYTEDGQVQEVTTRLCREQLRVVKYVFLENTLNRTLNFLLLSCRDKQNIDKLENKAKHISGYLIQEVHSKILVCIGGIVHGFSNLHRSYLKNEEWVYKAKITDQKRIFCGMEEDAQGVYPEEYLQDLFLKIKYQTSLARELMGQFFDNINIKEYSLRAIGKSCGGIVSKVNQYAVQMGVDTDDVMSSFYRRYLYCSSIQKMKNEISGYIVLILNSIQLKSPDPNKLFNSIEEYIRKHYHQKLTLQIIASDFYVTPAYCSNLLKEKLNKSFNEYLSEIRIDKAKQLLLETEMSIDSISDEIGYSNPKYFFKVFKKMTGYTPQEYRESARIKGNSEIRGSSKIRGRRK